LADAPRVPAILQSVRRWLKLISSRAEAESCRCRPRQSATRVESMRPMPSTPVRAIAARASASHGFPDLARQRDLASQQQPAVPLLRQSRVLEVPAPLPHRLSSLVRVQLVIESDLNGVDHHEPHEVYNQPKTMRHHERGHVSSRPLAAMKTARNRCVDHSR
jgi:hypothetical protein